MSNGDKVRFRQGTKNGLQSTQKQPGQLLFATYDDPIVTSRDANGNDTIVQGDIYFDLDTNTRINLANDVDKARTLFSGTASSSDSVGAWNAEIVGIDRLYDGITIALKISSLPATSGYNTLNINGLGAKLVWFNHNQLLLGQIPNNAEIILTYRVDAGDATITANSGARTLAAGRYYDGWVVSSSAHEVAQLDMVEGDLTTHHYYNGGEDTQVNLGTRVILKTWTAGVE